MSRPMIEDEEWLAQKRAAAAVAYGPPRRLPSIEGVPAMADRPRCPACDASLRPWIEETCARIDLPEGGHDYRPISRKFNGKYHGYGHFCSLRCCDSFANAAYRGGYRIK